MLTLLAFMDMKMHWILTVPVVALAMSSLPLAALSYGIPAFKPKLLSLPWKQNMLLWACKDLLPLVWLIRELSNAVGLDASFVSNIHCKVHERTLVP